MKTKNIPLWRRLLLVCALSTPLLAMADAADYQRYFEANDAWQKAAAVTLRDGRLHADSDGTDAILLAPEAELKNLLGNVHVGDSYVRLEYLLSEGARAGIYLQGRYEIILSVAGSSPVAGSIGSRWDGSKNVNVDGTPALLDAAKEAGQWQTLEVRFRAPRYDDASNKTDNALILEAKINDQVVHRNTILPGFTQGSVNPWETTQGPIMLRVVEGQLAIRNLEVRPADFRQIVMPTETGGDTNEAELVDFVARGKQTYNALGCQECHAVDKNDTSMKTGPNMFGLFQRTPRDREIVEPASNTRFTIKADYSYLYRSVREPGVELATIESGDRKGEAYLPIMPPYMEQIVSDKDMLAIGAYLETLNDAWQQGPVIKLVDTGGPEQYDPMADDLQFLVDGRVRIQRGPMLGVSARAVHVGQPNAVNYTFDPRILGIAKLWQGGFLEMSGELRNRGGSGLNTGYDAREIDLGESRLLFAPLNAKGEMIDFSFKEALFRDNDTVEKSLWSKQTQADRIAAVNAQFLGYTRPSDQPAAAPAFNYRVGNNTLAVSTDIASDGQITVGVEGELKAAQSFRVNTGAIGSARVSAGSLEDGVWKLPAGTSKASLTGKLMLASSAWQPESSSFNHLRQPLKTVQAEANLPAGYSIENYLPPQDNYGRDQLFEALGIALAEDGTIVVATRTAGIWRIVDGQWQLFAEGFFDSLGVEILDKKGLDLVVSQKAELTRVRDTSGDGLADRFDTLFDAHSFHGNYHTYMHGPARGADGAFYVSLNLAHADEAVYKADGQYMGAQGGYSGWMIRVTLDAEYQLFASGLRSPAGLGVSPDGVIWYTENQGEFVGTSKMFSVKKDGFYGHPSGLVDLPGMTPDSPEIQWDKVKHTREHAEILFPHNSVANAPGHPVWDTTEGKFGPFAGQILVGDQTQSNLLRVTTEKVGDVRQGAVMPFMSGLASGVMRGVFLPDGSLLVGQTGRGWQAKGGHVASLQRIIWDGKTTEPAITTVSATQSGFRVELTHGLEASVTVSNLTDALAVKSWVYRDAPDYGSAEMDNRDEAFSLSIADDRKSFVLVLDNTEQNEVHPEQTARVYHVSLQAEGLFAKPAPSQLDAYYTLYRFLP